MRLKPSDIDHIIDKIEKLSQLTKKGKEQAKREAEPLSLSNKERWELDEFERYEKFRELISEFEQLHFAAKDIGSVNSRIRWAKGVLSRIQVPYDAKQANVLRAKAVRVQEQYERAVKQHFSENVRPQREQLEIFLYVRKEALERLDSGIVKRIQALFDKEKGLVASEQEVSEVVFQLRKIKAKQEHSIAKKASGGLPADKSAGTGQKTKPINKPKTKSLSVDVKRMEVRYKSKSYSITERQAKFLKQLNKKPGVWISGSELKEDYTERLDKIKNKLPKPILKLIESHTRNGYRLVESSK